MIIVSQFTISLITTTSPQLAVEADFEYCTEPEPVYGTCGDCHCIRGNEACPTGDQVPQQDFSVETIDQWKALTHTNPMNITCNPYTNTTGSCDTVPSQVYTELWETAVCAITYDTTFLDENQCPTEYTTDTYPSKEAAEAAGAQLTHYGSCGVCSSLIDLAVYVEYPDLTGAGQECGLIGLADTQLGIECFESIGYTTVRQMTFTFPLIFQTV